METALGDPEIVRDLRDRLRSFTRELHRTQMELRRVWSGHVGLLSETMIASGSVPGEVGQAPYFVDDPEWWSQVLVADAGRGTLVSRHHQPTMER